VLVENWLMLCRQVFNKQNCSLVSDKHKRRRLPFVCGHFCSRIFLSSDCLVLLSGEDYCNNLRLSIYSISIPLLNTLKCIRVLCFPYATFLIHLIFHRNLFAAIHYLSFVYFIELTCWVHLYIINTFQCCCTSYLLSPTYAEHWW